MIIIFNIVSFFLVYLFFKVMHRTHLTSFSYRKIEILSDQVYDLIHFTIGSIPGAIYVIRHIPFIKWNGVIKENHLDKFLNTSNENFFNRLASFSRKFEISYYIIQIIYMLCFKMFPRKDSKMMLFHHFITMLCFTMVTKFKMSNYFMLTCLFCHNIRE